MKLRWIPMLLLLLLLSAVPARAAGVLHTAYLAGYPDGTIRPEAPVTRAQLAVILFRLAEHVPEQADADMPDVPPEHWAHGAAALYLQLRYHAHLSRIEDVGAFLDTAQAAAFASAVLLCVTLALNALALCAAAVCARKAVDRA